MKKNRRYITALGLVLLCIFSAPEALANKEEAVAHYKAGRAAYDIGQFDDAIRLFTAAYQAKPAAAFLFNIAQSHRQLGHCPKALFFYRRFVRLSTKTAQIDEVRQRIRELKAMCPEGQLKPTNTATQTAVEPSKQPHRKTAAPAPAVLPAASKSVTGLGLQIDGGIAMTEAGDLGIPVQPSLRISAGYLVYLSHGTLQIGALGSLFALPYTVEKKRRALMSQVLAHAQLSLELSSWAHLRLEVGGGVMLLSGLVQGNPLTNNGSPTSGALSLWSVRSAIGLDVPLSERWSMRVTPFAISYSPTKAGLIESIEGLRRIDASLGVGLRF